MSAKRVLGIVGSPRRGGNTDILVDEALAGAEEAGALTEKVFLNELHIAFCQGCETCQRTGECVQQDDMAELLENMQRSQVWVVGTPVYWHGPTAQLKTFIDRCYAHVRKLSNTRQERRAVLLVPLADHAGVARLTTELLDAAFKGMTAEILATVVAPGVWDPGAVRGHDDVLAQARQAGREAVEKSS
ncbi:MAG: flavodoxin family protein [Anaerolineae bacterium]|jgi:multimeric flavodoxin WrbA